MVIYLLRINHNKAHLSCKKTAHLSCKMTADSILAIEFRLGVVKKNVDHIYDNNPDLKKISQDDLDSFKKKTEKQMKEKYPNTKMDF